MREVSLGDLGETIPQAIFDVPIEEFGLTLHEGNDDLDEYIGAAIEIDGHKYALLHYRGYPEGTTSLRLPEKIEDLDEINIAVDVFMKAFGLQCSSLLWHRIFTPYL